MCRIIDQNIKKCFFWQSRFSKFSGGACPGPPRKARASPSQWSLRDHCGLNDIRSQVSRFQLSKSWQVCILVACNCFCDGWRKVKAESEAERSDYCYKKSTVCWRRRKTQGKRTWQEREREDWRTVGKILINPLSFTHLAQSHGVSRFPAARSLSDFHIFCWKSGCRLLDYKRTVFGVVILVFLRLFQPYALRLICFALFPRLSPWRPWQLGTPTKVLPLLLLFYPLGRFERIKTVLMGTNTPHTCIPGLVWQRKARRFSQFELKEGELGFPIHFACVSAALYHRGHAAAIFSP